METASQTTLHARHRAARARVMGMLIADADSVQREDPEARPLTRRLASKLNQCGATPVAYWSADDQRLVVSRGLCKSRICPTCAAHRIRRMQQTVSELAAELDSPRLLTLTLKSSNAPLSDQLKRLRICFRRLRQRKAWKRRVQGGICVIEVTYNARRDQWHPHIHCLIDATYWKQSELADAWEQITGDSRIVDIRMAKSTSSAVHYLSKYVGKTGTPPNLPARRIGEWVEAVHGLRLMQPFGNLHGRDARDEQPSERTPLEHVAPLTPLLEQATNGDPTAKQLVADLAELRTSGNAEQHATVKRMLSWWWETFQADVQGRSSPACPSDAPLQHTQAQLYDDEPPWVGVA